MNNVTAATSCPLTKLDGGLHSTTSTLV